MIESRKVADAERVKPEPKPPVNSKTGKPIHPNSVQNLKSEKKAPLWVKAERQSGWPAGDRPGD